MESWLEYSGIELVKAFASGEVPPPPQEALVGLRMLDASHGRVDAVWEPTRTVINLAETVHGGYVAMVLDDVCCMAGVTLAERFLPMLTLSLNIDYLRPVRYGTAYTVAGTVAHPGRRRIVANAVISDPDGRPVAQATGSVIPNESFRRAPEPTA